MKVLLSIKPEFVQQIVNGNKKFEYRKRIFKQDVESVIIYSTMPVGKIVGEFKIGEIINDSPEEIWNQTYNFSGITEDFFMDYFSDRVEGFAIKIKDFFQYKSPIDPKDIFKNFVAPQSFKYIRSNELSELYDVI